jgi:metal-sulfur cluster biosynthetic enzyme
MLRDSRTIINSARASSFNVSLQLAGIGSGVDLPTMSDPADIVDSVDPVDPHAPPPAPATPAAATAPDAPPPTVDQVKLALRKVKDPELNLNIVDLGLVYEVMVDGSDVQIDMTLTSPGCPAGPQITGDVERAVKALPGVASVNLNIVWQPFWSPDRIEPRVRAYMGL